MDGIKTLNKSKIGEKLKVHQVLHSDISAKLLEMGFYSGKEVELMYRAPFGDPLAVRVGNYVLSMRKSEAAFIEVCPAHL